MAKSSGLGDNFYLNGQDLSGDISAIDQLSGGPDLLDFTTINKFAYVRYGGLRGAVMSWTMFMDPTAVPGPPAIAAMPTTDQVGMYVRGATIGNPSYCVLAKQLDFDPTRGTDGSLNLKVDLQSNAYGGEWGNMLTPGIRTDSSATVASAANSYNTGGSLAFGGQLYIEVFSVTGTSVTLTLYDSADNSTFAAVVGFATSGAIAPGGAPSSQRIASTNVTTIRQYVAIASSGTFSNAQFAVMLNKNPIAGQVF